MEAGGCDGGGGVEEGELEESEEGIEEEEEGLEL